MLLALVGGGFLLNIWEPSPFLVVIAVVNIDTAILFWLLHNKILRPNIFKKNLKIEWLAEWKLIHEHKRIRLWFIANSLWEAAISVLKVFIVLYFTRGLNFTLPQTSAALSLVGLSAIVAAPVAGKLADKYGHKPVILTSLVLFAIGLTPPLFTVNPRFIAGIIPVAFFAVILMTLPYSLLMGYLPKEKEHGAGAALFLLCQGLGALFGPLIAGFIIQSLSNTNFLVFGLTHGYAALFPVSTIFLLASIPFALSLLKYQHD
jgi:MFS family permease